jgi:hypothetical protein
VLFVINKYENKENETMIKCWRHKHGWSDYKEEKQELILFVIPAVRGAQIGQSPSRLAGQKLKPLSQT